VKTKHIGGAIIAVIVLFLCGAGLLLFASWGGDTSQPPHALNQD